MVEVYSDFDLAIRGLSKNPKVNEIFVIGGATVYEQAIKQYGELCKLMILTRINKAFEADTFFPNFSCDENGIDSQYTRLHISKTYQHKDITYDFCFIGNKRLLS